MIVVIMKIGTKFLMVESNLTLTCLVWKPGSCMQTTAKKDNEDGCIRNRQKHKNSKLSTPENDFLLRMSLRIRII